MKMWTFLALTLTLAGAGDESKMTMATWHTKATLLVLVEPVGSSTTTPAYKVVSWDEITIPNTEADARLKAAQWSSAGLFVPGENPDESLGVFYPAHRVHAVEVYAEY